MTKRLTISLLPLLLAACSFSPADYLPRPAAQPQAASPTSVPVTDTPDPSRTATYTPTPTLIGAKPSSTPTDTPPPTNTFLLVTLPTDTRSPTDVLPSATLSGLEDSGFASVEISESEFHWGSCEPSQSTMTVKVSNVGQVFSVVLFVKFRNKSTGADTGWDDGTAMEDKGGGMFVFTFDGNQVGVYTNSWMVYQLIGTDSDGKEVARSPAFPENLTISPCP